MSNVSLTMIYAAVASLCAARTRLMGEEVGVARRKAVRGVGGREVA